MEHDNPVWKFDESDKVWKTDIVSASMGGRYVLYDPWAQIIEPETLQYVELMNPEIGREVIGWRGKAVHAGIEHALYLFVPIPK
jgi:hypothetical protein